MLSYVELKQQLAEKESECEQLRLANKDCEVQNGRLMVCRYIREKPGFHALS